MSLQNETDLRPDFWASVANIRIGALGALTARAYTREEKDAVRLKIKDDMAAITALLHDVEKMQNMVNSISRLPPEVLCRIFAACALVEKPEPWTFGQPRRARLGWIKVTHICRLWRQVALTDTSLWADIPNGMAADWMKALVRRSRQSPLSIDLRNVKRDAYTWDAVREVLALELPRVKGLTVGGDSITTHLLRLFENAPGPGLALQSLRILMDRWDWLDLAGEPRILQLTDPRALSHLVLHRCLVSSLDFPCFPNLTHFEIDQSRCSYISSRTPNDDWLIRAVLQMPKLEALILGFTREDDETNDAPTSQGSQPDNGPHVHLQHLRKLRITGLTRHRFEALMSSIAAPSTAFVECEIALGCDYRPMVHLVIQRLKAFAPDVHTRAGLLQTLSFSSLSSFGFRVQAWSIVNPGKALPELSLTFNASQTMRRIPRVSYRQLQKLWRVIADEVTAAFDVRNIHSLTLPDMDNRSSGGPSDDEHEEAAYLKLFRRMPSVQNLVLSTDESVPTASLRSLVAKSLDMDEQLCFPQLRELSLYKFDITADKEYSDFIESILRCRQERFRRPLDKLTLLGFYSSEPNDTFRSRFSASQFIG